MGVEKRKDGFIDMIRNEAVNGAEKLAKGVSERVLLVLDTAVMSLVDYHSQRFHEARKRSTFENLDNDPYIRQIADSAFLEFKKYVRRNPDRKTIVINELLNADFLCFLQRADQGEEPFAEMLLVLKGMMTVLRYERDGAKCLQYLRSSVVMEYGS